MSQMPADDLPERRRASTRWLAVMLAVVGAVGATVTAATPAHAATVTAVDSFEGDALRRWTVIAGTGTQVTMGPHTLSRTGTNVATMLVTPAATAPAYFHRRIILPPLSAFSSCVAEVFLRKVANTPTAAVQLTVEPDRAPPLTAFADVTKTRWVSFPFPSFEYRRTVDVMVAASRGNLLVDDIKIFCVENPR